MEAIAQQAEIELTAAPELAPVSDQKSVGVRVAQNTLAVLAGRAVALACGAFGSILLARLLGVERLGQYGAIYAYLSLFMWLASAGLGPVISREAARNRDQAGNIFRTGFWVCLGSVAITLVLALALSPLAHLSGRLFPLVAIASLEVLLLIPANIHGLIFQVDLRQWYGSTFNVVRQVLWVAVVVSLYLAGAPLLYVVIGRLVVAAVETGLNWHFANKFIAPPRKFLTPVARQMIRGGVVIALTTLASSVYLRIDQVMLHSMVSDRVLGTYVAAVRTSELFEALPSTLGATMFPLLCAAASDRLKFDRYLDSTCRLLILAATTICVAISVGAPALVVLLYGPDFKASAPLLAFLVWSEVPIFFAAVLYNGIVAVGLEKYLIIPAVAGACINLGLNLLLIPKWAAMGSVWATVVAYSVSWMGILLLFSKTRPLILRGLKVTIPATALAILVTLGATHLPINIWLQLILAMAAFGTGAALLRLIQWSDAEYARGICRQVWSAIGGSKRQKQSEAS